MNFLFSLSGNYYFYPALEDSTWQYFHISEINNLVTDSIKKINSYIILDKLPDIHFINEHYSFIFKNGLGLPHNTEAIFLNDGIYIIYFRRSYEKMIMILSHELIHYHLGSETKNSSSRLPLWFNESLAYSLAGFTALSKIRLQLIITNRMKLIKDSIINDVLIDDFKFWNEIIISLGEFLIQRVPKERLREFILNVGKIEFKENFKLTWGQEHDKLIDLWFEQIGSISILDKLLILRNFVRNLK